MRILVHDFGGYAFPSQLSRELARRGHTVLHVYSARSVAAKGSLVRQPTDPETLSFESIAADSGRHRFAIVRRVRRDLHYGRRVAAVAANFRPDAILTHAPLIAQWRLQRWARRRRVRLVYWLQDMISSNMTRKLAARTRGLGRPGGWLLRRFERKVLRASDHIVAVSPGFVAQLTARGLSGDAITVLTNWAPLDEITPAPRQNAWAIENGLTSRTVFLYAGSIGKHDTPEIMFALAAALPTADVVVVSEGRGANLVRREAVRRGLSNVRVFPFQPYERLSEVLGSADVLLVNLDAQAGPHVVPSKVLSYLCARRPVLASMPANNLSAQTLTTSGAGIVTAPGDMDAWLARAVELAADPDLRARMADAGWHYAQANFDIGRIADQFERVLVPQSMTHG